MQAVLHYELSGGATVRITRRMDQTLSVALQLAQGVPTPDDLLALVGLGPDDLSKTMEGPRQVDWVDPAEDITIAITARALGEGGWASLAITVEHVPAEQPGK